MSGSSLRLGSLFTGYGSLDLAISRVFGPVETMFVSDIEPGSTHLLAQRTPGVPNLGDVTPGRLDSSVPGGCPRGRKPMPVVEHGRTPPRHETRHPIRTLVLPG